MKRQLIVLGMVIVMVASVCTVAATTVSAHTATSFTIGASTTTPAVGNPFQITGTLKTSSGVPLAYKLVHLESHKKNADGTWTAWADLADTATMKTNVYGKVSSTRTLTTTGVWEYRWHFPGTSTYAATRSSAKMLSASLKVGSSPIGPVDSFILANTGGFVARLSAEYSTDNGATWHRAGDSGDIVSSVLLNPPANEKEIELGTLGVPNNALVKMHANVIAGTDKVGSEVFRYVSGSGHWAKYTISGTTLINRLTYNGYGTDGHVLHWQSRPLEQVASFMGLMTITVSGDVLDENNNRVSNVQYEIFDWNTKEVYKSGVAETGHILYVKYTGPYLPVCGIKIIGNAQYTGIPGTQCEVNAPTPPDPFPA